MDMGKNKYERFSRAMQSGVPEEGHINKYETRYFVAEHDRNIPTLDFHGMPTAGADIDIENFLLNQIGRGQEAVKILYGHGTGAMRKVVTEHLRRIASDHRFSIEAYREGTNGTHHIVLLKKD